MGQGGSQCLRCHDDGEETFSEQERRRSKDGGGQRRRSSGLSRYSNDFRHVIEEPLKVGAFNVRRFGTAKMKDKEVVDVLVRIISQFDVIVIQEIVETKERAINELVDAVNKLNHYIDKGGDDGKLDKVFKLELSPRLGRNKQKEQYGLIYKSTKLSVEDSCVYPDPEDIFIREPFIVKLSTEAVNDINSFTLISVHTQPKNAVTEIDHLVDVQTWAESRMNTKNILILGDLNAGGQFVKASDWPRIRLRPPRSEDGEPPVYKWLIPDHVDTTASNTLAAYDRIIACGDTIHNCVVPGSAQVFRFDDMFGLSEELTLRVSDHYPVYCLLNPSVHPKIRRNIQTRASVVIIDKRLPAIDYKDIIERFQIQNLKIVAFYTKDGNLSLVEIRSKRLASVQEALSALLKIREKFPELLTFSSFSTLRYKLENDATPRSNSKDCYLVITCDILDTKGLKLEVQTSSEIV